MLIDSGTTEAAAPWRARAAMSTVMSDDSAHITEPTVIRTRDAVSTLRLPYMSPARPRTGVRTAPDSRVAVTIQETAAAEEWVSRGRSGSRGTTTVCMTAMSVPHIASTGTVGLALGPVPRGGGIGPCWSIGAPHSTGKAAGE
ncbi:hypothetical protein EV578_114185 [Streptomyces sp. BK205]|nr:hypothetical protein EV578_114185 [Streptomyces sp. BK205]